MTDSQTSLARLRRRIERIERSTFAKSEGGMFALGCEELDARIGGGLARGALHELCATPGDHVPASGFALMLALRAGQKARPILWVREDKAERMSGALYGPGMVELGAEPDDIILVQAPDTLSALRAGADIIGCMGLAAAVIEPFGAAKALDLTASRKLVLAAEKSGIAAFMIRESGAPFASAAATRWQVAAAPSRMLAGEAPGHTALSVNLLRHRGGIAPFSCVLEWNRDTRSFAEAPLSGAVLPAAEREQVAA